MSALGRISGPLLKSNLVRNGVDLAFETDLLYLDVNNQRIGIKTATPEHELDINGTTRTVDLIVTNRADIGDVNIVGNTISSDGQYLNLGTLDNVVYNNKLRVDDIDIEGNVISTNTSNSNLELRPNGTGTVDVHADMNVSGNIHATGNITADGSITLGDADTDNIVFNADVASNIIPDIDNTYTLGNGGTQYNALTDFTLGDTSIVIASGAGTLSVPAAGPAWVDDVASRTTGYTYLLALRGTSGTLHEVTTTGSWSGTNPQQVTVNAPSILDGTYDVVQFNLDARRWADVWVDNIITNGVNTGTIVVDGVDLTLRQGNIYYVAENGADTNTGTHQQDPFASVEQALSVALSGDTVFIYPGAYTEVFPLTVPSGVTVKGQGIRAVSIQPTVGTNTNTAFLLNGEVTIEDITIKDFYSPGYAFEFAPGFEVTSRSPYIKNITVITKGSTLTAEDPRGFNAGDAGKGAYIDGSVATANSKEAAMLFHSATFITPGVDAITATNGARIEWLNSFTYFADRSIYAFDGAAGLYNDGKTRIRLSGITGTFSNGQTVVFTSADSSTVVNVTVDSFENTDTIVVDGKNTDLLEFDWTPQSIVGPSGTATAILNVDVRDFGAEIRLIGSASVYGNFGLVGDGEGVLMYAIGHNLAYIGNGKEVTNDPNTVIQANEVVEANNAKIRYNSVDHKGDFRVGDLFYINQDTGSASFSVSDFIINTTGGVTFSTGGDTTFIDGTKVETGDWRISGNTIETLTLDANFTAASGQINLQDNVDITGNLDVTGNVTIGGNIVIGDEATDTIQIVAGIDSDIIPKQDSVWSLGTEAKTWSNLYVNQINVDGIVIRDNFIETVESNANLELRANGTGVILVPSNDVQIDNDLTVDGTATLADTNITGTVTLVGDFDQTGSTTVTGNVAITQDLDVSGAAQFEEILIDDNFITTTTSNADLELRANGTGEILVPNNDVNITNNLTVAGDIAANNLTLTANLTSNTADIGDITISGTTVEATASNADLELRANGTGEVTVPANDVTLGQALTVAGFTTLQGTSVTGTLTHIGDTNQTGNVTLTGNWTNGDLQLTSNIIQTTLSNSDLDLRANGTGIVKVQANDVLLGQDLTVSGYTTLLGTGITGTLTHTGDTTQVGNVTLSGDWTNGDIQINDNFITTSISDSDLDLRANGLGIVKVTGNDVTLGQALTVSGATDLQATTVTGLITHTGNAIQTGVYTITGSWTNGDLEFNGNTIATTQTNSDLDLRANGSGVITVPSNDVTFSQALTVSGATDLQATTVTGTITHVGNTTQTGNFDITGQFSNGDIVVNDNVITTTLSNSDLELRANGTGEILVPNNNVQINNNLTVSGDTDLQATTVTGTLTQTGNVVQTGDINLTGNFAVTGTTTISSVAQFEEVNITNNVITTTTSNADLELRAAGTGDVIVPNNDVTITNDLYVDGTITVGDINSAGTITANRFSTGDILIDDNFITTTTSNSDLELRANGTGEIVVPSNDVILEQDLTVNGSTNLKNTTVVGSVAQTGDVVQTGNFDLTGDLNVSGSISVNAVQFENIQITGNVVETTLSNSDLELRANGTGQIVIPTNDVAIAGNLTVSGTLTVTDIDSIGQIAANTFFTGDILVDDNYITTTTSNSDLELRANGTGSIVIDTFSVNGSTITSSDDIVLAPGSEAVIIDATGSLKLPTGSTAERPTGIAGQIRYNSDLSRFEGFNGTNWINLKGVEDLDGNTKVTAELTEGANDNTIRFDIAGSTIVDVNATRLNAPRVTIDDIQLDGNVISTTTTDTNLVLNANGTGSVVIDNFAFKDNTITNTVANSITTFEATDNGYVKFDGTYGMVIPVGSDIQRPPIAFTETGQMRFNTTASRVEIYDGANWVSVAGTSAGITRADAENIAFEIVLSLG